MKILRRLFCFLLGHSFSNVEMLMFEIQSEGRCFNWNLETGERTPITEPPTISCRCCGKTFTKRK
jgi:hypothetical protein